MAKEHLKCEILVFWKNRLIENLSWECVPPDTIVIGGRIAGSVLASLLGDRGHRVLVLDRATFPSDTLSTHFFRSPALRAFSEVGVYDEVQSAAPHLTVNYNVIDGNVFSEPVDRPEDFPFYMCVRRITLDDILVRRENETSNVELLEGAVANALLSEEGRISGVAWKASGELLQAGAKVVVGADGVRSFVAKEVGPEIEQEEPVRRAMYYAYFRGIEANEGPAAEFHYRGNNLAYCLPTDDGLTMLAASVPLLRFDDFKKDPEGSLMTELGTMPALAPRLVGAKSEGHVRGSGSIPCYLRVPYGEGASQM